MKTAEEATPKTQKLKQQLAQTEKLFQDTGHYYGVKELALKTTSPFRYERAFAKLRGALVAARETALHISASPIVRNIGELCFALYTPEGDSIVLSTGIIVHVHTMSEAIKWMLKNNYEINPGINEGDLFCNNDPSLGNVHTADVHTIMPIFREGELIGWAGGVTHQVDIGGATPGHDPIVNTSRYEDGLYLTCEKIGEKDIVHEDYRVRCQRGVRTPMYWDLDEKCRIAGCHLIREAVYKFIEEEGYNYYQQFIREVIEEGRQIFKARVKERLIPGRYRTAAFVDLPFKELHYSPKAKRDTLMHAPMEMTIAADGEFHLSFEGASMPGYHAFNCGETSMQGGLWVLLSQTLTYDGRVNDGSYLAMKYHFPRGSWANPQNPTLSYATPWMFLIAAYGGLFPCLSRGFFSRGYREEVVSGYGPTGDAIQGGGIQAFLNEYFPVANFELSCVGLGASAVKDGLDWGYAMWNPEGDQGDAEMWELLEQGIPYLSRRVKPGTAGYGKYRGGSGWECVRVVYGTKEIELYLAGSGLVFGGGIFGGYPMTAGYRLYGTQTNLAEIFAKKQPYPLHDENPDKKEMEKLVKGNFARKETGFLFPATFQDYDIIHYTLYGGPGYGDPLERELKLCKKDLDGNIYLPETIKTVYGMSAKFNEEVQEWSVDEKESMNLRGDMRKKRAKDSVPFDEFWEKEREKILTRNLIEPVKTMYKESMTLSPKWREEFITFWQLPENFTF